MVPWQPPRMLAQMTNALVGIERPAGADQWLPPAACASRPAVAGQRVEDEDRVVARGVERAPGAVGDGDSSSRPPSSRSSAPISIDEARGVERRRRTRRAGERPAGGRDRRVALLIELRVALRPSVGGLPSIDRPPCLVSVAVLPSVERRESRLNKDTPAEAGVRLHAVPLSRRSLCRIWHLAVMAAGCRASQGRFPPPVSIRQHSSVVDQNLRNMPGAVKPSVQRTIR